MATGLSPSGTGRTSCSPFAEDSCSPSPATRREALRGRARYVEHVVFAAFVLWLLGTGLTTLALVAGQFPRLAAAGAALARALRRYLLGGL
ncbi:hypothetical protein HU200_031019 [Digitaria exilis]|uniref:Uncharacterized protein n=1 Tax=Digitaria exilis TaxID=1010633 RepID=A0A835BRX6_9POAL|nr:hypothetical protein HU200_031019 [Digitaria exilis]